MYLSNVNHHCWLKNSVHIHPFHHQHMRVCANEMQFEALPQLCLCFKLNSAHTPSCPSWTWAGRSEKRFELFFVSRSSSNFNEFPPSPMFIQIDYIIIVFILHNNLQHRTPKRELWINLKQSHQAIIQISYFSIPIWCVRECEYPPGIYLGRRCRKEWIVITTNRCVKRWPINESTSGASRTLKLFAASWSIELHF